MKRMKAKQIVTYLTGMFLCKVSFAGCYPFIPAYFAAVYLQDSNRAVFTFFIYIGMLLFLPLTQTAKYAMAVLCTLTVIHLVEWVDKNCKAWVAAVAAGVATGMLSAFGGVLNWTNQISPLTGLFEGLFIFGLTMVANRFFYLFYLERKKEKHEERKGLQGEERLKTYADSFLNLSKVFSGINKESRDIYREEDGQVKQELAGKICISCNQCALCWEKETNPMQEQLSALIAAIREWGMPKAEYEKSMKEFCPYTDEIIKEAVQVFEKIKLNAAWYQRLKENREVIAEQLDAMAYIMEDCATLPKDISKDEARMLSKIKFQARECGIIVYDVALYEKKDGHKQWMVEASVKKDGCIPVKELTKAISAAAGQSVRVHKNEKALIGKEKMRLVFEEDTAYYTMHGVARLVKEGASVSGDNFSFQELEEGEFVMSLSDGMGSGTRACKESEMVIELMEKFLEAGFSKETAIRMMNSAMVLRGEDDLFSTIDISAVDLYNGNCTFYKIGASATFIKREDSVECLISENLPVGIYHKVDIETTKRKLKDGDFVIMVSDGVLEYLHVPEPEETMKRLILGIKTNHPGKMAKQILERVMLYTGGRVEDDMTVMAAAIWEKE